MKNLKQIVSIIIPVLDQVFLLEECLDALYHLLNKHTSIEVIVVDNGSTDGSEKLAEKYSFISLQIPEVKNPYKARNKGAEIAKGDILTFLDAKCIPTTNYISEIERLSQVDNWDLVAGDFELIGLSSKSSLSELAYAIIYLRTNPKFNSGEISTLTGNMMIRKNTFNKLGGFDERRSGGDVRLSKLAEQKGFKKVFAPSLRVYYHPKTKSDLISSTMRDAKDSPFNVSIFSVRPAGFEYMNQRLSSIGIHLSGFKLVRLSFFIMYLRALKYYHQTS